MYRRVLFIGLLPLLSERSDRRAALGVFFAMCSAIFYREVMRAAINVLLHVPFLLVSLPIRVQ